MRGSAELDIRKLHSLLWDFWQFWGSLTFCWWFGSADPYLCLTDPDPTPFFSDFKDAKNFNLQALFQSAQKIYKKREGSGARSGSGSGARSGSGSVHPIKGSGSGRPKHMRILRIRIPYTDYWNTILLTFHSIKLSMNSTLITKN